MTIFLPALLGNLALLANPATYNNTQANPSVRPLAIDQATKNPTANSHRETKPTKAPSIPINVPQTSTKAVDCQELFEANAKGKCIEILVEYH